MCDVEIEKMSGDTPREDRRCRSTVVCRKGGFRFLLLILTPLLLLPFTLPAEDLTCSHLPVLLENLQASHYERRSMTEEIKMHAVDQMIKHLDPSKTLLYESDLEKLKPLLKGVFASVQGGDCTSLQQVYDLLVVRVRENESVVRKILGPDFRPDGATELNINTDKRPYAKTAVEKEDLLRKIVQFQIENDLLAGIDLEEAKRQQIHRYELQTMRVVERTPAELITTSAEAFALALDPHTNYLSSQNLANLRIQMQLSLEGIGAILTGNAGFTIIEELIPGGGAERSGLLKPKDKIIAVAQEGEKPIGVIDMNLNDVVSMIRGKKGTRVTLTILRQAERTERFDVTIVRDKIDVKEQEAKISYETRTASSRQYRFGVIDLPSFYGDGEGGKSSYEDVKKLLLEAGRQHIDGIVLDLSRNGGGLLKEAVRLTGLLIGKGGIVATRDNQGRMTIFANGSATPVKECSGCRFIEYPAEGPQSIYTGPLVVLTSRLSASASEIVAGALQDYRRAVIVGSDHTFGKGSVQALMQLPWELGGVKVTTELYFLPGGKSTQKTGVAADVILPDVFGFEDIGEAALDYPLSAQAISPFLGVPGKAIPLWKPVEHGLIAMLASRSRARIANDAKFIEIIKNNREAADRHGIISLSDFRKKMEKEGGGKDKETLSEQRQKARDQNAPYVNESVNILLDMVSLYR